MPEEFRIGSGLPQWSGPSSAVRHRIPAPLRRWLFDQNSLTKRLRLLCGHSFAVRLLSQQRQRPLPDEATCLGMRAGEQAVVRQVYLQCGASPLIYARTVIPFATLRGPVKRLAYLGNRPLGEVLFADKTMRRREVEVARLLPRHSAFHLALDPGWEAPAELWGRRSVFYLSGKPLLVSEIFLPALARVEAERSMRRA